MASVVTAAGHTVGKCNIISYMQFYTLHATWPLHSNVRRLHYILDESMDCFYVIYAVFALQEGDLFLNIMHQLGSRGM